MWFLLQDHSVKDNTITRIQRRLRPFTLSLHNQPRQRHRRRLLISPSPPSHRVSLHQLLKGLLQALRSQRKGRYLHHRIHLLNVGLPLHRPHCPNSGRYQALSLINGPLRLHRILRLSPFQPLHLLSVSHHGLHHQSRKVLCRLLRLHKFLSHHTHHR